MTIHIPTIVFIVAGYVVAAAAVLVALLWLLARFAPPHWALGLPGRARLAADLFKYVDVAGGHAHTWRRLLRVGPWGIYAVRYAPGYVDERPEPAPLSPRWAAMTDKEN